MLQERDFPHFSIKVERIAEVGGDIAIFFDKELLRLLVTEIGDNTDSFGMDIVYTNHIKLLKAPIAPGHAQELISGLRDIIHAEVKISSLGFGGKLLRTEDLAWTLPLTGSDLRIKLKF